MVKMTKLNNSRVSIRPEILGINSTGFLSEEERFQNETLRPIIKLQHELLIAFFNNYLSKIKMDIRSLNPSKRTSLISSIFNDAQNFKTELKGLIVGHFTTEEYSTYIKYEKEINKRIFTITKQRINSIFPN